jgi:tripartite-type tricarboxylate transporter receptor subunit TctC
MNTRRQFLRLAASAAILPALPSFAWSQTYPTKPVRILVGFAPGNAADVITRLIGQSLSTRLGWPFVTENRPGAGGTLGTEAAVRSAPDGYTLVSCSSADAVNASIYERLNYNFLHDIAPVAAIASGPLVLVVNPSFSAKTVPEFVDYAKANPGKVSYGSAGIGTVVHVAGELFNAMAGVSLVHVPYRGLAPAVTDLLGGQVQAIFSTMPPVIEHIRSASCAVWASHRSRAMTLCPTYRPLATPCQVTRRPSPSVSARPEIRLLILSTGSTMKPTLRSPIRRSGSSWPASASSRHRSRLPNSVSFLPMKPRSGVA